MKRSQAELFLLERTRRDNRERRLHIAIADLLRKGALTPGWIFFHCPNGEYRTENTGALLQRMGVRPGVSDILLVAPPMGCLHCLELKDHGLKPTPEQRKFMRDVQNAGGRANWADSYDGAVAILKRWGALERLAG